MDSQRTDSQRTDSQQTDSLSGRSRLRFDANALRLDPGVRLLEASAGTGKTFALAHLVLRLVSEADLRLSQILVVTFTEAAAAELRDRIGRRLQAGLALVESPTAEPADAVLNLWWHQCLSRRPAEQERVRVQLLLALEDLAAADITTIHGFCRRSLMREALVAGRAPQLQLEDPEDPGVAEVVHTYWQQQVLALPPHLLAGLRRCGFTPALMEEQLRSLDGDPSLQLDPLPEELPVDAVLAESLPPLWEGRWQRFLALWQRDGRALQQELHAEAARWKAEGAGDKTKPYRPTAKSDRCDQLDSWIAAQPAEGHYAATLAQELLKEYYHPGTFCRVVRRVEGDGGLHANPRVRLPQPALMEAVAALVDGPYEAALLHALHRGRRDLEQRRRRRGVSTFAMLLRDLDPGPDPAVPSPLLEAVAARYQAALIDEFQDTDPIQWRILSRAFGGGEHLLVMVGDPKQAIYRFRGGDLPTYLQAAATAEEIHALDENRRSTPALIDALNRLMAPGLRRSGLPVPAVRACADRPGPVGLGPMGLGPMGLGPMGLGADGLVGEGLGPTGLGPVGLGSGISPVELLWLGDIGSSEEAEQPDAGTISSRTALEQSVPTVVARYLQDLLSRGIDLGPAERRRPLAPEDICLLVSHHRQAELLRAALERVGIASRLVSKADVFTTPAATVLQRFLDALADPGDANRLRLLAASPLLAWSTERIAAASPAVWGELAGRLTTMAGLLGQRGLLGVLADLLAAEGLARLALGGRLAADLQQLSELVQQRLHSGQMAPAAAADWLRRRRLEPPQLVSDEDQAHSDRADGAVSVITIHRSKGLEFPVVICPFLWQAGSPLASRAPTRRWQPPGAIGPVLDLHRNLHWGTGYQAEVQRLQAEDSERERLAYVALTRAQDLLVLAWGPALGQQSAPLLPWLLADHPLADANEEDPLALDPTSAWRLRLEEEIGRRQLPLTLVEAAALLETEAPSAAPDPVLIALATGAVPQRRLGQGWGRYSYSAWIRGRTPHSGAAVVLAEALEEGRDTEDPTPEELLDAPLVDASATGASAASVRHGSASDGLSRGSSNPGLSHPESLLALIPAEDGPLSAFPCGPMAGDCLHRILEVFQFSEPATAAVNRQQAERELLRSGLSAELLPALLEGLERVRTTPFGGELGAQRLADLAPAGWLSEMRFDLSLAEARAAGLAAAFGSVPGGSFGAAYAEQLAALPIASRGFLTGAIDLVLPLPTAEGQERWWVLDWKSNWLGRRDADGRPRSCGPHDYHRQAMVDLMVASHYPLQAHLYLVALHRYLRWRLLHYCPETHLGGFIYVFLRGTPGAIARSDLRGIAADQGAAVGPRQHSPDPGASGGGTPGRRVAAPGGTRLQAGAFKTGREALGALDWTVPGMLVERPPLQRLLALDAALGYTLAPDGFGQESQP